MERLIRKAFTTFYKIFKLYPSSSPFISGDSFRKISDYEYKTKSKKNRLMISKLKNESIIFVNTSDFESFMAIRGEFQTKSFKIICHNSDLEFNYSYLQLLKDYNDEVFSVNAFEYNEKLVPIPIGLENRRLHHNGILSRYINLSNNIPTNPAVFHSFSLHTNPKERGHYLECLNNYELAEGYDRLDQQTYLETISKYMFCFSPPGNGIDCHRTWEAITMNVVPICVKSPLIDFFVSLELPIWAIEDFSEITKFKSPELLKEKYLQVIKKSNKERALFDFWKKKILGEEINQ